MLKLFSAVCSNCNLLLYIIHNRNLFKPRNPSKITMNSKAFTTLAFSVLILTLVASSVSALSLSASSLNPFTSIGQSQTLKLTANENSVNFTNPSPSSYFSISPVGSTNGVSSATYNVTLSNIPSSTSNYGDSYSETFNLSAINFTNSSDNKTIPVKLDYVKSFCSSGDQNDTGLTMYVTISNNGNGNSDTQWQPLDQVDVQVELDNNQNIDLNNVYFVLGLFKDGTNNNVAGNLDWIQDSEKVQVGDISAGDNYKYTFSFKANSDIKTGSYRLMVKAYSYDSGENKVCIDHSDDLSSYGSSSAYYAGISVSSPTSSKSVIVDTSSLPTVTTASCRQQVTLTPMVYNIGSKDYKDQILVKLYSADLGLNLNQTVYGNLNSGDGTQVPFTFTIPSNATEKTYSLYFTTYYDYNQGRGSYYSDYRYGSSDTFNTLLTVSGNCVYATPGTTQVSAQLQSGGKAGEPLVVQATITNTGSKTVNYGFGLEGYNSWAKLSSISPLNVTLAPGQSQNIALNLNVNQDATGGDKQFSFDVYSNGYLITQQPLSISITPSFSLSSITGGVINGQNAGLWAFNILLIIAIIVVLVIVLRRRK